MELLERDVQMNGNDFGATYLRTVQTHCVHNSCPGDEIGKPDKQQQLVARISICMKRILISLLVAENDAAVMNGNYSLKMNANLVAKVFHNLVRR